jgi:hypothetical protein
MDPNASSAQNAQKNVPPVQTIEPVQPAVIQPAKQGQNQLQKTPISVPGSIEEGSAVMPENPDAGDDEEEIKVAPQEMKNQAVGQQGMTADAEKEVIIVSPSVPEFESTPEVEKFVEKTPDQENPVISKEVERAGVTHSGPGVIDTTSAPIPVAKIPVSYDVAVVEEKQTKLHDSKHWLMGMVVYIWRKVNPDITKKVKKEIKGSPSKVVQTQEKVNQEVKQ